MVCRTERVFDKLGDTTYRESYYCGNGLVPTFSIPSIYRTLTDNAPTSTATTTTTTSSSSSRSSSHSSVIGSGDSSASSTGSDSSTSQSSSSDTTSADLSSPASSTPAGDQSTSSGLTRVDQIAIGVSVGLGVPLIAIALLMWIFPNPLQRIFGKSGSSAQPGQPDDSPTYYKTELPAQPASSYPVYPSQQQPQGYQNAPQELWVYETPVELQDCSLPHR
ncbi:hypothetical protein BX600DRAFT_499140 [Xylariales sp. PMI_506]|nr:hypothetical protein BX600DRAFT_499140 [Xylariales sp. PMI_506]